MKEILVQKKESLLDKVVLKNTVAGADTSLPGSSCDCSKCRLQDDNCDDSSYNSQSHR